MTDQKHTQEPWGYIKTIKGRHVLVSDSGHVADFDNPEDAHRAYACVNAMQGVEDPAAFMRDVRACFSPSTSEEASFVHTNAVHEHLKGGTE